MEIVDRQSALERVSRYNVTWLASQTSTELVRFQERVAAFSLPGSGVDKDEVQLRLDILANRVKLLGSGEAGQLIRSDQKLAGIVTQLEKTVSVADNLVEHLDDNEIRVRLRSILDVMVPELARLAAATNRQSGDLVAKDQHDLNRLHWMFAGLLAAVLACALALLVFVNWIQRRFVRQLLRAKEAAEAANIAKSRFLANMSHELRTPMNGVLGMVELIKQGALSDEQRRFADIAHQSGKVMLELVGTVLDHSKIEAGCLELRHGPVDVREITNNTADLLRAECIAKGLNLAVRISPGLPSSLLGDATRLRQVLINLIGNAIKFTQRGEVAITVSLVDGDAETAMLRFEVTDTGIGIAADQLPLIFEAFSQADASSTRPNGGTGLGLAIARQLIELMGGEIGVTSEPHVGSTFWFTVQLRRIPAVDAELVADNVSGLSVLLVTADDEERDTVTEYLSSWQIWPVATDSGERTLTLARRAHSQCHAFDLVLISRSLPDMASDQLARAIWQRTIPAVPWGSW